MQSPKKKIKYYLNPYILAEFRDGKMILVDYKKHKEHPLTPELVHRLNKIDQSHHSANDKITNELLKKEIIALKPFKKTSWKMGDVTTIFHYGSKDLEAGPSKIHTLEEFDKAYLEYSLGVWSKKPLPILPKKTKNLKVIKLPRSQHTKLLRKPLWSILSKRKTSRNFFAKPISLVQLSTLLYTAFAKQPNLPKELTKEPFNFNRTNRFRRTSPSVGGLQPTMAYVCVLHVKNLKPGIYFYDCLKHSLKLINQIDLTDKIGYLLEDQHHSKQLSVGIFMTSQFDRVWFKYFNNPAAYRCICYDIGHLSQTLLLVATALGLNTWLTAATRDSDIEKILKIDTKKEQYMFFVGIGIGDNNARFI